MVANAYRWVAVRLPAPLMARLRLRRIAFLPLLCYDWLVVFADRLGSRVEERSTAPSSSGPGRQVLILKIAGSTPAGVTIGKLLPAMAWNNGFTPVKRGEF